MTNGPPGVIVIGGPTASGKSALALGLAEELGGTVINADTLQLYPGLPVLTAQPDAAVMAAVPHRLYGTVAHHTPANAGLWCSWADAEIEAALASGSPPIVVGGTGLYLEALVSGLSAMPPVPASVRAETRADFDRLGREAFRDRLIVVDAGACRLNMGDTQRLLRAWEVYAATGTPLSTWQDVASDRPVRNYHRIALLPARDDLYRACNERFVAMLEAGAIEEVRQFQQQHPGDAPVIRALGYKAISAFLDGAMTQAEMIASAQADTRHYAKRQTTWFRNRFQAAGPVTVIDRPQTNEDIRCIAAAFTRF